MKGSGKRTALEEGEDIILSCAFCVNDWTWSTGEEAPKRASDRWYEGRWAVMILDVQSEVTW